MLNNAFAKQFSKAFGDTSMSKKSFIENIEVKTPCSEDWNEMTGSDKIRLCSHCSKSVNNLSAMTRKQALKIIRRSQGGICVRYIKNPLNNRPVFADKIYKITRRAGITAGVLGASLSLSTLAFAQSDISLQTTEKTEISQQINSDRDKTEGTTAAISGKITDSNDAIIPNVQVSLINKTSNETLTAVSDENGFYEFKNVAAGTYMLKTDEANGFRGSQIEDFAVAEAENIQRDIRMDVGMIMGDMVVISYENPLHRAVANNDLKEVKNLLALSENINSKDKNYGNITPLFLAVENGNVEIVQALLNFGAKINARNDDKRTPLMLLDEDATADLAGLLIRYGAKINLADAEGNTALILASRSVKPEILQLLLTHGANINAQNKEGQTALMSAADEGSAENVKVLLQAGANVNLKNKDGETALDLADSEEIENLLKSYGAAASVEAN